MKTVSTLALSASLALLLLSGNLGLAADARALFTVSDPKGDDHGDGSLVYPIRDDLQAGDLDVVSFAAYPDPDGTAFEVTFARNIAKPDAIRVIDDIGTKLKDVAKLGFYTFNVDVYVDTDRVPGSGQTRMLPGRKAEVDPAFAWDRAICVTPRPFGGRDQLRAILKREAVADLKREKAKVRPEETNAVKRQAASEMEELVYFPTIVKVLGPKIRFVVPSLFLGGQAKPEWGYVVVVSGADLQQKVDVTAAVGLTEPGPDRLMILPIGPGTFRDRFGTKHDWDEQTPPLVDILVPAGKKQEELLDDYDPRSGRPVRLPGVVPGAPAK